MQRGNPVEQIVRFVKSEKIDLIAMPTCEREEYRRFRTVTAKVLHDGSCPVLTDVNITGPTTSRPVTFSKVLCAIDQGPQSRRLLKSASQFATDFHAKLAVVPMAPASPGLEILLERNWRIEVGCESRMHIEKLFVRNEGTTSVAIPENEAKGVCLLAEQVRADLLVIGRGPMASGRFATNGYAIICQPPCPVITV